MSEDYDVLIVGGGHGGSQAAAALRQHGFQGSVALIDEERDPPYDRTPLSKEYLLGEKAFDRLLFRAEAAWTEMGVALHLGCKATAVDAQARTVELDGGRTFGFGRLIWAAGGAPRRLICLGHDLEGVHYVRNRADVDRLLSELDAVRDVVVVGGGYIGLEAAAGLIKLGKAVALVEAQNRLLARVSGEPLSRFYETEHRAHGVDVRLGASADRIIGDGGRVTGVQLVGGEILNAQMVVVGVGIIPSAQPLIAAGAAGGNGVRVDGFCTTSLADIYAIGDCAEHPNRFSSRGFVRLESVQNAKDQADTAAKAICGRPEAYASVPWFWSNQYDLRLQTVGLAEGYDQIVTRGDPASRSFSCVYLRGGRVSALDCVNAVRDYAQGKALVLAGARPNLEDLKDTAKPLRELAVS